MRHLDMPDARASDTRDTSSTTLASPSTTSDVIAPSHDVVSVGSVSNKQHERGSVESLSDAEADAMWHQPHEFTPQVLLSFAKSADVIITTVVS